MSNVTVLSPKTPSKAKKTASKTVTVAKVKNTTVRREPSRALRKRIRRQLCAAGGIGLVALVLTGLSLSHLAHGITIVTGSPAWESWSMAIGIDLGFIALEMAQLCAATDGVRRAIGKFTKPAIIGTLTASAIMNAFAFVFGAGTDLFRIIPAALIGLAIPGLIYALTRVTAALWMNCDR